jgi:hypothetical protein
MYIQINEGVPLNNMNAPIASAVAKMRTQETYPIGDGITMQHAVVWYFEDFAFGDSVSWDTSKSLDVTVNNQLGHVRKVYKFQRTSEELDAGISTESLYNDIKAAMIADGFTAENIVVTP